MASMFVLRVVLVPVPQGRLALRREVPTEVPVDSGDRLDWIGHEVVEVKIIKLGLALFSPKGNEVRSGISPKVELPAGNIRTVDLIFM